MCVRDRDGKHLEKKPDEDDLKVIEKINSLTIPYWYPTDAVKKGDKTQEAINKDVYKRQALCVSSSIWKKSSSRPFICRELMTGNGC